MSEDSEAKCPCCKGKIEYFPDQDGASDNYCTHCGWREHVPSSQDISAALTLHGQGPKHETPTIVLFVEGGVVQAVEGEAAVRVVLCDFDVPEGGQTVGGRACHIGVWNSLEEPSSEFGEVLRLVARDEHESEESTE